MDGHGRTDGWMDGSGSLSPSLSLLDYDERGEATFVLLLLVSLFWIFVMTKYVAVVKN